MNEDADVAHLRTARCSDIDAVVDIFQAARAAAVPHLPILHTDAEDRAFFGEFVAAGRTTLAADDERTLGFIVLAARRVDHLYVVPGAWRRGVGGLLLRHAQTLCSDGLELWVFQRNRPAIAFYEAHGFAIAEVTDGAGNEEREPDARMTWTGA